MRTAKWTQSVSVLDRVSAILNAFPAGGDGLTITEIAQRAGLPKSTVSRLARNLVETGYLDRDGDVHYLGIRLYELGLNVEEPRRLREAAGQAMRRLSAATGCCVQLAVDDGDRKLVIASARVPGDDSSPRVGDWLPDELDDADEGALVCATRPVIEQGEQIAILAVSARRNALDPQLVDPLLRASALAVGRRLAVRQPER